MSEEQQQIEQLKSKKIRKIEKLIYETIEPYLICQNPKCLKGKLTSISKPFRISKQGYLETSSYKAVCSKCLGLHRIGLRTPYTRLKKFEEITEEEIKSFRMDVKFDSRFSEDTFLYREIPEFPEPKLRELLELHKDRKSSYSQRILLAVLTELTRRGLKSKAGVLDRIKGKFKS